MRDYKKLEVWKKSHELYMYIKQKIAVKFPRDEMFELSSQLRRAALSIPLNIVEGCGKGTEKDFARFLNNALGSAHETEYCLFVAYELGYNSQDEYEIANRLVNDVKAMTISLLRFLRREQE